MTFEIGQRAQASKTITEADVVLFAGVTGDFNPVHIDAEAAKRSCFGRRVAHGSLTAALVSGVLGTKLPGPGTIFLQQTTRFTAPVYLGDTVTARVEVRAWDEARRRMTLLCECVNQDGSQVLTGEAQVLAPEEA